MNFLSGVWLAVLGFLGLAPEPSAQVPITQPVVVEDSSIQLADETVATAVDQTDETSETPTADEAESDPATEEDDDSDAMVGDAVDPASIVATTPRPATEPVTQGVDTRTMIVAGGCFWCVEADLEKTPGVIEVVSGYGGGNTDNPTYKTYGSGGHREIVEVTYDANQISFEDILIVTLKTTDPTDDDGTFNDRGDKYSSAFFYETDEQLAIINNLIAEVDEHGPYEQPLAIDVEPRPTFWKAEDNHQDYYKGTLTKLKYQYYRNASGRSDFIKEHWGEDKSPDLSWRTQFNSSATSMNDTQTYAWASYVKPDKETLRSTLDAEAFDVTQEDGTERRHTSPLDKNWERGIYVDILSGEPLYSSRDKFDSGTGWPSFVAPITPDALTLHEDRKLFSVRTETRSAIADNHIGHVFNDGPADRGGMRYCMNGVALRFVPEADMVAEGYEDFLQYLD